MSSSFRKVTPSILVFLSYFLIKHYWHFPLSFIFSMNKRRYYTQHNYSLHKGLICDTQKNALSLCYFIECCVLFTVMLNDIKLNVALLSVVVLGAVAPTQIAEASI
jgi:hypothetical protein